jgi:hypothetical protein
MPVILICGGKETGKTTFAETLSALWRSAIVYDENERFGNFQQDFQKDAARCAQEDRLPVRCRDDPAVTGAHYLGRFHKCDAVCIFVVQSVDVTVFFSRFLVEQADVIFSFPALLSLKKGLLTDCTKSWKQQLQFIAASSYPVSAKPDSLPPPGNIKHMTPQEYQQLQEIPADSVIPLLPVTLQHMTPQEYQHLQEMPPLPSGGETGKVGIKGADQHDNEYEKKKAAITAAAAASTVPVASFENNSNKNNNNIKDKKKNENPLPPASEIYLPQAVCPYEPFSDAHLDHLLRETAAYLRKVPRIRKGDGNSTTIMVPADNFCTIPCYKTFQEHIAYEKFYGKLQDRFLEQGYRLSVNANGCLFVCPPGELFK